MKRTNLKQRKTFSLSQESVDYLEKVRRQKKAPSTSSVLDELIRQQKLQAKMAENSAAVREYYDSLTDEEVADDIAWGKFALTQFPSES